MSEASITVAIRIRPTIGDGSGGGSGEFIRGPVRGPIKGPMRGPMGGHSRELYKAPYGILEVVDDRILIFDPNKGRKLAAMASTRVFSGGPRKRGPLGSHVGLHNRRNREHRFVFDRTFDEGSSQEEVYDYMGRPLLDKVLEGYNATIFAYGATGCGKTYTISGTKESPGVIFQCMRELYGRIESTRDQNDVHVTLSYLKIYNETIRDLLCPDTDPRQLQLREKSREQIIVTNLSEHHPCSVEQVMNLIIDANRNRTVSPTAANAVSSRSHAVLQITLVQKPTGTIDLNEKQTVSTLSFIDLAGFERASATKNRGVRLHEGANINKSLLALGNCINALCDSRRTGHIPYRDSKLTRLLKFSLNGNCKTAMIVCVSPCLSHYDETLNALKYANQAKNIRTKALRNYRNVSKHVGSYLKIINEQKLEIEHLNVNKDQLVELGIKKYEMIRIKCEDEVINSIKKLEKSVEKSYEVKMNKAKILAKRRFIMVQKMNVGQFLKSFNELASASLRYDDYCRQLVGYAQDLDLGLAAQIRALDSEYSMQSELDFILKDTSGVVLEKLKDLEGWKQRDETLYRSLVQRISESVERSILYESSMIFDESISQVGPFDFVFDSFVKALNNLKKLNADDSITLYSRIITSCRVSIQDMLENGFGLIKSSHGLTPKASQYAFVSPTRGKASLRSKLPPPKLTPTKRDPTSPMKSPYNKKIDTRKVKWEVETSPEVPIMSSLPLPSRLTSRSLTATTKITSPGRLTGLGVSTFDSEDLSKGGKMLLPFLMTEPDSSFKEDSRMDIDS
ncbi:hypothetical protein FOA43_004505 [Brettanomyces nanus]|uniref:Kinesin motor domain-containing protein n=1 Tax=Eeniella nana TaxID=13502 RepID=A0A875SBK2_EENNA|nr:uncharacterized protein FOA43_004505 [Brettanomyces nanus]QPG77102.1 hypothetical protein FOA43_004505 [Brettanomyces nanus]